MACRHVVSCLGIGAVQEDQGPSVSRRPDTGPVHGDDLKLSQEKKPKAV